MGRLSPVRSRQAWQGGQPGAASAPRRAWLSLTRKKVEEGVEATFRAPQWPPDFVKETLSSVLLHVADDEQGQREEVAQVCHGQVHQADGGAGCGWGLLILPA